MEAKESKIIDILTENKKYIIPSYQRPYSWTYEHAEQLMKDIYESFEENVQEYFIGSLICIDKGDEIYEVVDGQQRLTTLSLILAKIRDLSDNEKLKQTIQKRILPVDEFSDKPQEPRLKIRKKEEELYNGYILQSDKSFLPKLEDRTHTQNSFINNFQAIEDYLMDLASLDKNDLPKLVEFIFKNVYVVFVKTESFSSAYRLFNVLNARGMSLKQSDLLKNRLFELAESTNVGSDGGNKKIAEKIEEDWESIEDLIGVENIDRFLVTHEVSRKKNRNKAVVVHKIAEHFSDSVHAEYNEDVIKFISSLKKSAKNYRKLKDVDFSDPTVYRIIQCLLFFGDEWVPPMLSFLNKAEQGGQEIKINLDEFKSFVVGFEKSYIHRWVSRCNKSQREVVCYDAVANINNNYDIHDILTELKKYSNNKIFLECLNDDVYIANSNKLVILKYILYRIDQEMQDCSVSKKYSDKVTIEHILPQNIGNAYWSDRFSGEEHKYWVNKLGNLTLLSGYKNSKAQNDGFDKKIKVYGGSGKTVSFDISKDVLKYKDWDIEALKDRHKHLLKIAEDIWYVH